MSNLSGRGQLTGIMRSGGGSGGTTNYNDLTNKPSINGVELSGNKSTSDLNISYNDLTNKPTIRNVPETTGAEIGSVLTHTENGEVWNSVPKELPSVASGSNGDVLTLSNGVPIWAAAGGGGGGSYSVTTIFAQDISTVGNITLTDSIDNYDFILVATNYQGAYSSFHIFPVDLFKAWCNGMISGMMCFEFPSRYLIIDYVNDTTLRVSEIIGTFLSAIYGINI